MGYFPKGIGNKSKGVISSQQLIGSKTKTNSSFSRLSPCQKVRNICKTFSAFLTDVFSSVTEIKNCEEAKTKLVVLKNIAANKLEIVEKEKKAFFRGGLIYAFALAEKEALEAKNNVKAMELEILKIDAKKVKGQFEQTFSKFPHIAEQIFENLDVQSFSNCQVASRGWKQFIFEAKPLRRPYFQKLEMFTGIPNSKIKKSLENHEFQTIQKMTNCASMYYKKTVNANEISKRFDPRGSFPNQPKKSFLYSILCEEKLNNTQFFLAGLMIKNMDNSALLSTIDHPMGLHKFFWEAKHRNSLISIILKESKWGTDWSSIPVHYVAVAQNHLAICKLIFEKDIQLFNVNWKLLLRVAVLFSSRPMCEFVIDKIQDTLLDKNWRQYINEIAETSNNHKETCSFIESLIKKYK